MKVLKTLGIFILSTLSYAGITQSNIAGGENNMIVGIVCGILAFFLLRSLLISKPKKERTTEAIVEKSTLEKHSVADFDLDFVPNGSDKYLNTILPNGNTIRDEQYKNYEEAIRTYKAEPHRSDEEDLINGFATAFEQTLFLAEDKLFSLANNIYSSDNLDVQITKVKLVIAHYEQFKDFCYSKGIGGKLYFQDMWEHCHNSKNPDFDYIDTFKEKLEKLEMRKWNCDQMAVTRAELTRIIREHPGILQKDIYAYFTPDLKFPIRDELMVLEQCGNIRRVKHGSSYELYYD